MTLCTCLVQEGQIGDKTQDMLRADLSDFAKNHFGSPAEISWTEIAQGSGYTAGKPSTSSLVMMVADKPLAQSDRIMMLRELGDLWIEHTGCSLNELVTVINDPVAGEG